MRPIIVERIPPWRFALTIEVARAKSSQIVTIRAEMVVNHVKDHREASSVRRIDQGAKIIRVSVSSGRSEEGDAIVTPVAITREIGNRHQLDGSDAEIAQIIQLVYRGKERAFRRKRAHVQFVDRQISELRAFPVPVVPDEIERVDNHGRAMRARRLPARRRVRV